MTTAAHTPGEWIEDGFQIKARSNGFKVADVQGPDRRARGKEWKEDMDCCMANARLITAAPELLIALQCCVMVMERELGGLRVIQPELREALAAIAKATGSPA